MSLELTHDDLNQLARTITDSVRHECSLVRSEFQREIRGLHRRVDELSVKQDAVNRQVAKVEREIGEVSTDHSATCDRLDAVEHQADRNTESIARIDERTAKRGETEDAVGPLTRKQKAALWTVGLATIAALFDSAREIVMAVIKWLQRPSI